MATNSLQSFHHLSSSLPRLHPPTPTTTPTTLFLKPTTPTTTISLSSSTTFSLSSTSTTSSPTTTTSIFDTLQTHLSSQNFRLADEETRRLLISLAGEAATTRGYIFFSEVQFIPTPDLQHIDHLWATHSNNKFGYSVQKKLYLKSNRDFTKLFIKLGWMKKLDTDVEQYNYRAFPAEFTWELTDDVPEGHLPLTNALRGTQLMKCLLEHPAFEGVGGGEGEGEERFAGKGVLGGVFAKPLGKKASEEFKTDYSF